MLRPSWLWRVFLGIEFLLMSLRSIQLKLSMAIWKNNGKFITRGSCAVYMAQMHKRKTEYQPTLAAMGDDMWITMLCTDACG